MKTLKFALIAAILSFALISYGGIEPRPAKKMVKISLHKACQDPGLRAAMYDQVRAEFLKLEKPGLYYAFVYHNNCVYRVSAKHKEWIRFLKSKPTGTGLVGIQNTHW